MEALGAILPGVLAVLAVGGLGVAVAGSAASSAGHARARIGRALGQGGGLRGPAAGAKMRATVRAIKRRKDGQRVGGLTRRLREAGLDWKGQTVTLSLVALALPVSAVFLVIGAGPLVALVLGTTLPLTALLAWLGVLRRKREKAIRAEFPNAVDIIVRGVRSGLPLNDCLRVIAQDVREPLRSEFRRMLNDLAAGVPMDEAATRFANRVPLRQADFFAVVIGLQTRIGGSLAESLSNLSTVMRERTQMRHKIRAMSSEATASGTIIASLPVIVSALVWLTSPDYISLLYQTLIGKTVMVTAGLWMLIGVLVMRKMISFEV